MKRARVRSHTASRPDHLVSPACERGRLRKGGAFSRSAKCDHCGRAFDESVTRTLERMVALPEPVGEHPCECGYPEMRRLPGAVFHCPACRSEVLPVGAIPAGTVPPQRKSPPALVRMLRRARKEGEPM
jgi:ribosomal protein L37AE/L43A